jgi:hypothetical protein
MLHGLRTLLIKALGGITRAEMKDVQALAEKDKHSLKAYENFVHTIYFYAGNYPAWKAQQEFRNILYDVGSPLTFKKDHHNQTHKHSVDAYLGRIVDAFAALRKEVNLNVRDDTRSWHESHLPNARGDHYVVRE